ncbi:MAG: cell wall metabolism sensor histidine kinase WalK [Defluviitaleaceae bacterium]|nr:cell wall metabolism sensor histidine kinase WalK [Defluviitaleaceae bacterium]MCL2837374.1 cell wall metabolism sensor histidine kinase WalK [Defluviitaleaceae bacterium]
MKSIRVKMVVMYLILVFIVIIAGATFTIVRLRINVENDAEVALSNAADRIRDEIIYQYGNYECRGEFFHDCGEEIGRIFHDALRSEARPGSLDPIEYFIMDGNASLLATSVVDDPRSIHQNSLHVSVVISAVSGEEDFSPGRRYPNHEGLIKIWMQYARPVTYNDRTFILYLRLDAEDTYTSITDITLTFLFGLLIAFVLAVVLGVFFAGSVNKPIRLLTKKAKEFARGALDQDIEVYSNDEIGQLTESFNNMAHELKHTLLGLENEKNQKEIVLHNVTDGVLAYDTGGRLIHANHVCRELLDIPGIERIQYHQMLRRLGIDPGNVKNDGLTELVLSLNDRYINTVINSYKGGAGQAGGVVLLLQDLTKHIHLDNMRKEFVANVSHELRTPLTTIKSYTETLLEEIIEAGESEDSHSVDFLKTIDGEADRMTLLVNDLLELSRLDNKQLAFNFQTFDLVELLKSNVAKHTHALEKKMSDKTIFFEPPEEEMFIYADFERINQVVNNIITNSLRYSGDDGIVEIDIIPNDGKYSVRIMDNGVGIPPEDLNRIFERFYRVDKARSRELGGTGLGLSISKEIIESHGGTLTARSKIGIGTCMTITLKRVESEEIPGQL